MRRLFICAASLSLRGRMGHRVAAFTTTGVGFQRRGPPQGGSRPAWDQSRPRQEGRAARGSAAPTSFPSRQRFGGSSGPERSYCEEGERSTRDPSYGGRNVGPPNSLAQDVQILLDLKRQYKKAKSSKERRGFLYEARRVLRQASIDPSTQDEKSVVLLLNSAVTFDFNMSENIKQAVQWMRENLSGLSAQNVALFSNAVGSLDIQDAKTILCDEIVPVIKSHLEDMTPVEIVMILQAFRRLRIEDNKELQNDLVLLLEPCIDAMHISELSTLATVLAWHPLKKMDEAQWRAMVEHIMKKVLTDVDRIHSKEAITFLTVSTLLLVEQDHLVKLLRRVTATSGFHTDEQVGELFHALVRIRKYVESPQEDLIHACGELQKALLERLERVAQFASMKSATDIWIFSSLCGVELPATVQTQILESVENHFRYHQPRFVSLCKFVKAAESQRLPSTELFNQISDFCIGKRPLRPNHEDPHPPSSDVDDSGISTQAFLFTRFFADLASLRFYLENVFAANGSPAPTSLTTTLPQELLAHVGEASPKQILLVVKRIALAQDNELRNTRNDEALLTSIEARMKKEGADFIRDISPVFLEKVAATIIDNPKTQNIARLLPKEN